MAEKGTRILLAEDEPLIRMLLVDSLEDAGFDVVAAETGDQALLLLGGSDEVNMLVTDIQMPGATDGNGVGEAARARHPELPIIYMTGNPVSLRISLGPRDVLLRKPFSPSEMLSVVHRLLG